MAALALNKKIKVTKGSKEYEIPTVFENRYILMNLIDEGGFGQVYNCQDATTHTLYVCKIVKTIKS